MFIFGHYINIVLFLIKLILAFCRFVHPGVTDKGNYTMFEMVRPLVPVNGPPQIYPPVDYRPVERPVVSLGVVS